MPLQDPKGPNYIKITKVYIDSAKAEDGSLGPYDYKILLDQEIQFVVGMELTGYNLPSDLAPTFIDDGPGFNGNNVVDFELSNGVTTTQFTFQWPEKRYTYENVPIPYLSYIDTLATLLNTIIENDPDFGIGGANEATFTVPSDPEERTIIQVSGVGVTGVNFLWASGPNANVSARVPMGFEEVDTGLALQITSPNPTFLAPFRYVDIFIKQVQDDFKPLARVFMTDNFYYGTTQNDLNLTRTRLLSSQPLKRLKEIQVAIRLEGDIRPPITTGRAHDLILTVFSLGNEDMIPNWVNQTFAI